MDETGVDARSLLWCILLRLVVVTSILVTTLIIQVSASGFLPTASFYYLIFAAYGLAALHFAWYAWGRFPTAQAWFQSVSDLLVISALVYVSGIVSTPSYFLYLFPIIAASLVISPRAGFLAASIAAILFGCLVDGTFFGVIPYYHPERVIDLTLGGVIFTMVIAWGSFFVIAGLVGRLSATIRRTRTALRSARKELILKERLAEAGRVSAGLAHEIRNPLAAISGSVQVLKESIRLTPDQRELMDIILKESTRVSQSIEQFLDFAAPGGGARVFADLDLAVILDETLKMLRGGGELTEAIRVEGTALEGRAPYVGNPGQFKQIFWNVLKNAIKAMPAGGTLTVDFAADRRGLRLRFADTGLGMTEEVRERVFEPFYSAFPDGGRGLGMATVRRIVDDYEGRIDVRSEAGAGTEIVIELPARRAPLARREGIAAP